MKSLFQAGWMLLLDLAATLLFLALYLLTHNIVLAVALSMMLAFVQIGWQLVQRKPVNVLQWVGLILVVVSGAATLVTHDPVFVMAKPSAIYLVSGLAMLQRGWMRRYMPAIALEILPDIVLTFGFIWAGLMFFSAAMNLVLAVSLGVAAWGTVMSAWGIASKLGLFGIQYIAMRLIGRRRYCSALALEVSVCG